MTETRKRSKDGEYLNSLARGLSVLKAFNKSRPRMTLSEVAEVTALNPATARRCLNTLIELGYVAKVDKQFILRPAVLSLGAAYIESMNLEEIVRPTLQEIRDQTGFSTALAVLSEMDTLFLVYVSTKMLTRIAAGVGTRFPAYATAAGRMLLAYQPAELLDNYLQNVEMEALTPNTETDKQALRNSLATIARQGYAITEGELDYDISAVAVPVLAGDGSIIASISSSTSTLRTSEKTLREEIVPQLQHAAGLIEMELRHNPNLSYSIGGYFLPESSSAGNGTA